VATRYAGAALALESRHSFCGVANERILAPSGNSPRRAKTFMERVFGGAGGIRAVSWH